ncbi:MAG: prepilin-type N-terminal cleavage/methylation domain-containing protein [Candidatus Omnitrophota bacterium]|jgi:prepilin-type N-terminal cleavage/methylation domain-containing protein|nr:MAG: prepilin-type N-terminal cleavage/methylation domain-containing protein [Candidatus Omnitrophota bacterium]
MKKGLTLIEVFVTTVIIVILFSIAVPRLQRMRINSNEAAARVIVQKISVAAETYAFAHNGVYASNIINLTSSTPRYLEENYSAKPQHGYNFVYSSPDIQGTGYSATGIPVSCNRTGTRVFVVTTNNTTRAALSVSGCI